jgi:hypothetical protein
MKKNVSIQENNPELIFWGEKMNTFTDKKSSNIFVSKNVSVVYMNYVMILYHVGLKQY